MSESIQCVKGRNQSTCGLRLSRIYPCLDSILPVDDCQAVLRNVVQLRGYNFEAAQDPTVTDQQTVSSGECEFNLDELAESDARVGGRKYAGIAISYSFNANISRALIKCTLVYWPKDAPFTPTGRKTLIFTVDPTKARSDQGEFVVIPYQVDGDYGARNDIMALPDATQTFNIGGADTTVNPQPAPSALYTALTVQTTDGCVINIELLGNDHPLLLSLRHGVERQLSAQLGESCGGCSGSGTPSGRPPRIASGRPVGPEANYRR